MRKKQTYLVISFAATTMAMLMEKCCEQNNMPGRIIPLPPEISAGCGLAWSAGNDDIVEWKNFMKIVGIEFEQIQFITM